MILQGLTIEIHEPCEDVIIDVIAGRPYDSKSGYFDQPFRVIKRRRSHRKIPSTKEIPSKEEIPRTHKKKKIILKV